MFFTQSLINKATQIIAAAKEKKLKITCTESCTGGLLSALFTEVAGASEVFERGFVVYSNEAKTELLEVSQEILESCGAVSGKVAKAMALGAIKKSRADISLAITGIAGPDGGSKEKPVGLVYIAAAHNSSTYLRQFNFAGNRFEVRKLALLEALNILEKTINLANKK